MNPWSGPRKPIYVVELEREVEKLREEKRNMEESELKELRAEIERLKKQDAEE